MSGGRVKALEKLGDEGGLLETPEGPTFIRAVGEGPIVLVIHGGPGFDHRYLLPELMPIASRRTLVFYDQPGCGRTPAPAQGLSAHQTFRHFAALATQLAEGQGIGVVAHSWGALVLAAGSELAAKNAVTGPLSLSEGLLINPVPFARGPYDQGLIRLVERVPPDLVNQFYATLETGVGGSELMRALMPYYRSQPFERELSDFPFVPATYRDVAGSLDQFDYTQELSFAAKLSLLRGQDDITGSELIPELMQACRQVLVMPETGHFPFFERPDDFETLCEQCLP